MRTADGQWRMRTYLSHADTWVGLGSPNWEYGYKPRSVTRDDDIGGGGKNNNEETMTTTNAQDPNGDEEDQ